MRKLLVALTGVIAAAIGGSAFAADLPVKAVYKAPPPVVFNWTGIYVGVHGGGVRSTSNWDVPLDPTNIAGGCIGCPTSAGSNSATSWLLGLQGGFNYQVGMWVLGVEADASWTRLRAVATSAFIPPSTINTETNNVGTIAGRFGVAWDRSLIYVKGGGAWARDKFFTTLIANPAVPAQTADDTRWGWMIGVGVEQALTENWSVKVEYNHLDFNTRREALQPVAGCCLPFDYDIRQRIDLVKAGLNYRFGGPVVARY